MPNSNWTDIGDQEPVIEEVCIYDHIACHYHNLENHQHSRPPFPSYEIIIVVVVAFIKHCVSDEAFKVVTWN